MKPRVMMATSRLRIVRSRYGSYDLEVRDGRDCAGRDRWRQPEHAEVSVWELVREVGKSLTRRDKMRRRRRGGSE